MSERIFRTPAPSNARRNDRTDVSYRVYTLKEQAANIRGERMGAPAPERNIQHAPNAVADTAKSK